MADRALDVSRVALKRRRTKIVATVGPASSSLDVLLKLIEAGVDIFRLNFSHGTHDSHQEAYQRIRTAAATLNRHIAIIADLCGPKIRVGSFEGGGIDLVPGAEVVVTTRNCVGRAGLICSEYPDLAKDLQPSHRILLDDGKLELEVREIHDQDILCEVVQGGHLSDKKGMNLPGVTLSTPTLTQKDQRDAAFAAKLGVDYLALSFVRAARDVLELKALLKETGLDTPVIAKIEKPEALQCIGAILEVADGIMVARGDLGVEVAAEEVPIIQQELIRLAIETNRPVIVATQMLESMIDSSRPTRAEVSDIAFAAMSRTDAVMLSAETAVGKHPVQAVATMDRVLRLVEGYQWKHGIFGRPPEPIRAESGDLRLASALSRASSVLSRELEVRAVVVPTRSGGTARLVSASRPAAPIVAIAPSERLCCRLALFWGLAPEYASLEQLREPAALARSVARRLGLAEKGQHVLMVWDSSPLHAGLAPTVSILTV